jgi:hypothetical protein
MSAYYYTPMRNIWIGALCALGIFLIAYDGWDRELAPDAARNAR